MAAALLHHHAAGTVRVTSAGSQPADQINPAVREVMAEIGIHLSHEFPKRLTTDAVEAADVVITMGCGDACPIFPGKRYLDWQLTDPAGRGVEAVRPIRDDIDARVRALLAELTTQPPAGRRCAREPMTPPSAPTVLFVCVSNSGKSQMAAGLCNTASGGTVVAYSAGTDPAPSLNAVSVQALAELGVGISHEVPKPIDPELLRTVDRVVTLGREVRLQVPDGVVVDNWDTDEPSKRGIGGLKRMRLVRDDINHRVHTLITELTPPPGHAELAPTVSSSCGTALDPARQPWLSLVEGGGLGHRGRDHERSGGRRCDRQQPEQRRVAAEYFGQRGPGPRTERGGDHGRG
jgi:protein-tyrosine-phosphatase